MVRDDGLVKVLYFGVARRTVAGQPHHDSRPADTASTPDGSGASSARPRTCRRSRSGGEQGRRPRRSVRVGRARVRAPHRSPAVEDGARVPRLHRRRPHRAAEPLRTLAPEIPPAVEAAILRALQKNPTNRFPSISAAAAELLPFAQDALTGAVPASMAPERVSAPPAVIEPRVSARAPRPSPTAGSRPSRAALARARACRCIDGSSPIRPSAPVTSYRADSALTPRSLPSPPPSRPVSPPPPPPRAAAVTERLARSSSARVHAASRA